MSDEEDDVPVDFFDEFDDKDFLDEIVDAASIAIPASVTASSPTTLKNINTEYGEASQHVESQTLPSSATTSQRLEDIEKLTANIERQKRTILYSSNAAPPPTTRTTSSESSPKSNFRSRSSKRTTCHTRPIRTHSRSPRMRRRSRSPRSKQRSRSPRYRARTRSRSPRGRSPRRPLPPRSSTGRRYSPVQTGRRRLSSSRSPPMQRRPYRRRSPFRSTSNIGFSPAIAQILEELATAATNKTTTLDHLSAGTIKVKCESELFNQQGPTSVKDSIDMYSNAAPQTRFNQSMSGKNDHGLYIVYYIFCFLNQLKRVFRRI